MKAGKNWSLEWEGSESGFRFRVNLEESYEIEGNRSVLKITSAQVLSPGWYGFTYYPDGVLTIGGVAVLTCDARAGTHSVRVGEQNQWFDLRTDGAVATGEITIDHDADGTGFVTVEPVGNGYGTFSFLTQNGDGGNGWSVSGGQEMELTRIPRASGLTLSADRIRLGETLQIAIDRASGEFVHTLAYRFGALEGIIAEEAQTTAEWTLPMALAAEIPTETSAVVTVSCVTCCDGAVIGSSEAEVTAVVPENEQTRPRVTMTVGAVNDLGDSFAGLYLTGKSRVRAEFDAESTCSEVREYRMTVDGEAYAGNPAVSGLLSSSGEITVTGVVTDARGFQTKVTRVITVQPYGKPVVVPAAGQSRILCVRCDGDGNPSPAGEGLLVRAGRKYSPVTVAGEQKNFCGLRCRIKASGTESYSPWLTLLEGAEPEPDEMTAVVEGVSLSPKISYTVQLGVVDTVGDSTVITLTIPADVMPLHLGEGGKNAAVGQYCDYSHQNAFDIGWKTYFHGGVGLKQIFEGSQWNDGEALGSVIPEAEVTAVGRFSLLIAVARESPVLCVRLGESVAGSGMRMSYQETEGVGDLTLTEGGPVTALYGLI